MISKDLMKLKGIKVNKEKISVINIENEEKPNFYNIAEEIDKIILKI